jgi:hypothetical protein
VTNPTYFRCQSSKGKTIASAISYLSSQSAKDAIASFNRAPQVSFGVHSAYQGIACLEVNESASQLKPVLRA